MFVLVPYFALTTIESFWCPGMWKETVGWHQTQIDSITSKYPGCVDKDLLLSLLPRSIEKGLYFSFSAVICWLTLSLALKFYRAEIYLVFQIYISSFKMLIIDENPSLFQKLSLCHRRKGFILREGWRFLSWVHRVVQFKAFRLGGGAVAGWRGRELFQQALEKLWQGWLDDPQCWSLALEPKSLLSTVCASCCQFSKGMPI